MKKRAQTATEYMLVLSLVLIIALVVVSVLRDVPSMGSSTKLRSSTAYWESADIGIVGFSFDRYAQKDKICFQYAEGELEEILYELLMIEIDFKSGKIDFKGKILGLFNQVHFEKKTV